MNESFFFSFAPYVDCSLYIYIIVIYVPVLEFQIDVELAAVNTVLVSD